MSNDDWERWSSAWKTEERPMPDVLRRARTDRLRTTLALVVILVLAVGLGGSAVWQLVHAQTRLGSAEAVLSLSVQACLLVGVGVTMGGTWRSSGDSPLEQLADLERRHRGRRQLLRFVVAYMAMNIVGGLALGVVEWSEQGMTPQGALRHLLSQAACVAVVVVVHRRVSHRIDRELAEAEEARRLLQEPLTG